jgi:hypothetical protein
VEPEKGLGTLYGHESGAVVQIHFCFAMDCSKQTYRQHLERNGYVFGSKKLWFDGNLGTAERDDARLA